MTIILDHTDHLEIVPNELGGIILKINENIIEEDK